MNLPITQNDGLWPLTVTGPTTCEGRCVRQSRALGQYAVVTLKLTPAQKEDTVSLFAYCDPVDQSGSVYKEDGIEYFRKGIARGIADVLAHYRSLGFGIAGLRVAISRMVVHPVDSTEGAFRVAARNAFSSGLLSAGLTCELEQPAG